MESPDILLEAAVPQIRVDKDAEEQHKILHGHSDAGMSHTISLFPCDALYFNAIMHEFV